MTYVVARPGGRFEIRESVHTANGPRARSLANFKVLTPEVLENAKHRAVRPFVSEAVVSAAGRAGAPLQGRERFPTREGYRSFVDASRRMAAELDRPPAGRSQDPGTALMELLDFTDVIVSSRARRPSEPLRYPALARVARRLG
jgi:hypothetical protein